MVYAYIAFMANEMQGIFNLNKFQACLNLIFLFYIGKDKNIYIKAQIQVLLTIL